MGDLFVVIIASFVIVFWVAAPFLVTYLIGYSVGADDKRHKDK